MDFYDYFNESVNRQVFSNLVRSCNESLNFTEQLPAEWYMDAMIISLIPTVTKQG